MGDCPSHRRAAVGVEATPLAEDEHQVPEGRDQQTARHCEGPAGGHLYLGRVHGAARVHQHNSGRNMVGEMKNCEEREVLIF